MLKDLSLYRHLALAGLRQTLLLSVWLLVYYVLPIAFLFVLWRNGYGLLALVINLLLLVPFWINLEFDDIKTYQSKEN